MRKRERDNKTDKMIRRKGGGGFLRGIRRRGRDASWRKRKGKNGEGETEKRCLVWSGEGIGGKDAWRKSCGYDRPPCEGWFGLSKILVSSSIFSTS